MSFPSLVPEQSPRERLASALALVAEALLALAEQPETVTVPAQPYLTPKEVAAALHPCSVRAVADWCRSGALRAELHGRRWKIPAGEVERFKSRARVRGGATALRRRA